MTITYFYSSSHQAKQSQSLRDRLLAEHIAFEEIDVTLQPVLHPTLSYIPSLIIEKDGFEFGRYEGRDGEIDLTSVKQFLLDVENTPAPEPPTSVDYKDLYKKAAKTEDKLEIIAQLLGLT